MRHVARSSGVESRHGGEAVAVFRRPFGRLARSTPLGGTYGCGPTIAAGSMLTEMIVGRTIEECRELTAEQLIEALDGMPPDKLHCPRWQ